MVAPEPRKRIAAFPQYRGMDISALQTLKQVSWLVEYTLWTYIFCDYNFQQFQFQQMILTLLHYLCSFSPQDVLAYIFQDLSSVCLDLKLLPWTSETYIVLAVFDISVFCFARCACKIHSVLHLCCSTLCNCSALCLGLLLYNILMRLEHVRYITASLVHSQYFCLNYEAYRFLYEQSLLT